MRSRYDLCQDIKTPYNEIVYKDIMTLPLDRFIISEAPLEVYANEVNKYRFDLLMQKGYGFAEFDDILLLLNAKESPYVLDTREVLKFPTAPDLERYYNTNKVR